MPFRKILKVARIIASFLVLYFAIQWFVIETLATPWSWWVSGIVYVMAVFSAIYLVDMMVPRINLFSTAPTHLPAENQLRNEIALTFDDGPYETTTEQILQILKKEKVRATFFCVGSRVEQHPDLARRIVEEGHTIANHSYSHRVLPALHRSAINDEVLRTQEIIRRVTGVVPLLFRPPKGYKSRKLERAVAGAGLRMVGFSYPMFDVANPPADAIVRRASQKMSAGDILLFHDQTPRTGGEPSSVVQALPKVIGDLKSRGLTVVRLDNIFGASA
jgi:peptidoglycan-N-acetylglucosamine deacetylase